MLGFKSKFAATFIHQDCSISPDEFFKPFPSDMYFDIVSCQFSIHYMFSSEDKVRNFLQNASNRLVTGGYFVCTHPDANVIVKKLREDSIIEKKSGCYVVENKYYSLISDTVEYPIKNGPFGLPYGFYLTDNLVGFKIENNGTVQMHYVPEYLVIMQSLVSIARDYGLELVESKNLHEFYADNIKEKDNRDLFVKRMKFSIDKNQTLLMEKELWDVSYLYRTLAFKKVSGEADVSSFDRSIFKPRNYFKHITNRQS